MRRMRTRTRNRLTGACDAIIAAAAALTIAAVHWPWVNATLTPPDPAMPPSGDTSGLQAHGSLWAAIGIAVFQLALLLARYYPGGRLRVPGDGVLLALGSALICLIAAGDMIALPAPWANIYTVTDDVPSPWWGNPDLMDGATLVMRISYGAPVAVAAGLTSLITAIVSPGPPAVVLLRHRRQPQETGSS